ncbi:MAG: class I SAM-dependent methyltransferase [Rhodothalassiaceae bacterium]
MASLRDSLSYAAAQGARLAFYGTQYALSRRIAGRRTPPDATPDAAPDATPDAAPAAFPPAQAVRRAMRELLRRDLANVGAGLYPPPPLLADHPARLLRATAGFFADLPKALERRQRRGAIDVRKEVNGGDYPPYYLQNFHYQTGGWLSEESARLYDHQVEVLFTGTADAMRRQGLVSFRKRFGAQRRPRPTIADIGTGTGRFLALLRGALPQARLIGVEPSPAYRAEAARRTRGARLLHGFAEALPLGERAVDGVSAVFLFHELPPAVRVRAAAEIARVLKPGGLFVMVDALQYGDVPDFDGLLARFPARFHEPYFASYLAADFAALLLPHGLVLETTTPAFLSKVFVFRRQ